MRMMLMADVKIMFIFIYVDDMLKGNVILRSTFYTWIIIFLCLVGFGEAAVQLQFHRDLSNVGRNMDNESLWYPFYGDPSTFETQQMWLSKLELEYSKLKEAYERLLMDYDRLEKSYAAESMLRIGSSLALYYDRVRSIYGPRTGWTDRQITEFMAKLASHDLGVNCWPKLETSFHSQIGEYSYKLAWTLIHETLKFADVNGSQPQMIRVKKILESIKNTIRYEYDLGDVYLAPAETLTFKSGDCDDYATLAAALLKAAGIESAIAVFQNNGDPNQKHFMTLIHIEKISGYGYKYFNDLTNLGLKPGRWIVLEPQHTLEMQNDSDWFKKWKILAATEITPP